ncbi:hypothetical protein EYF80_050640 [Liparis tanakae]|uniref:Uncharacterized protein n=1 Tax=Liparis tanakae TaxID=230148 RepID=A0A4Z2FE76_9TELE|nr:hypothetical protein EYF80_050640 [Liparis tanakae]
MKSDKSPRLTVTVSTFCDVCYFIYGVVMDPVWSGVRGPGEPGRLGGVFEPGFDLGSGLNTRERSERTFSHRRRRFTRGGAPLRRGGRSAGSLRPTALERGMLRAAVLNGAPDGPRGSASLQPKVEKQPVYCCFTPAWVEHTSSAFRRSARFCTSILHLPHLHKQTRITVSGAAGRGLGWREARIQSARYRRTFSAHFPPAGPLGVPRRRRQVAKVVPDDYRLLTWESLAGGGA